jgi:hypothetical protein
MAATCPNCGQQLEQPPKRKKLCPHCALPIYLRQGKLLTQFEALQQDWLVYLQPLSVTPKTFDEARARLQSRFGFTPRFFDTVWLILNDLVGIVGSSRQLVQVYYEMARVASYEKRSPRPYIAQALPASLKALKRRGTKYVTISSYAGEPDYSTCEACRQFHGSTLPMHEAIDELPVPSKCTSDTGCRCEYVPAEAE